MWSGCVEPASRPTVHVEPSESLLAPDTVWSRDDGWEPPRRNPGAIHVDTGLLDVVSVDLWSPLPVIDGAAARPGVGMGHEPHSASPRSRPSPVAVDGEEANAEVRLELGDALRHHRRGETQSARGQRKAAGFGDGNEGLHGGKPIHRSFRNANSMLPLCPIVRVYANNYFTSHRQKMRRG